MMGSYIPSNNLRIFFYRLAGYIIGKKVYVGERTIIVDELADSNNLILGNRVAVSPGVIFVTSSAPNNSKLARDYAVRNGTIFVEDDVWIGAGAIVLPNVRIGYCSIVGAGSVVTKDVCPYSVVVGSPARKIKELHINENSI